MPVSKRRPPNRRRSSAVRPSRRTDHELEFEEVLEQLLADPDPLAFLTYAASIAEVLTNPTDDGIDAAGFLHAVEHADSPAVRALAAVIGVLAPPLAGEQTRMTSPAGVARIAQTRVTRAVATHAGPLTAENSSPRAGRVREAGGGQSLAQVAAARKRPVAPAPPTTRPPQSTCRPILEEWMPPCP